VRRLIRTPGLLWPVLAVVAILVALAISALTGGGEAPSTTVPPRQTGHACAAPAVRATAHRSVRARERSTVTQPVEVTVVGDTGRATARETVRASATATATVTVHAKVAVRRRACARGLDLHAAERRAASAARAAARPVADEQAAARARALIPAARERAGARAHDLARSAAERRVRALVPDTRRRLRAAATARLDASAG